MKDDDVTLPDLLPTQTAEKTNKTNTNLAELTLTLRQPHALRGSAKGGQPHTQYGCLPRDLTTAVCAGQTAI